MVTKLKYTYILFKRNIKNIENISHVNITNIPTLDCLTEAIEILRSFDPNTITESYCVDNITVSKNFNTFINLTELFSNLPNDVKATYNSETFPGVFLKYPNKLGTAILFHTGRCVLLGCKTVSNIENIIFSLLKILKCQKNVNTSIL